MHRFRLPLLLWAALVAAGCRAPRAGDDGIRVLVYNIHAGKDRGGHDNLARIANIVGLTRADVALLQEVDRRTTRSGGVDQLAELERLTGLRGAFGRTLDYQGGEYGIAVITRGAILHDTLIPLPVEPPQERAGGSREPRGMQDVLVVLRGDTLRVLNTHIDASADDRYRRQEAAAIIIHARALRAAGARVLIGGDFNSTPESVVQEMLREAGFDDLFERCGRGPGLTYPDTVPVKRIDYLYALGGIACERAEVLDSLPSDHRPLLFTVRLRR